MQSKEQCPESQAEKSQEDGQEKWWVDLVEKGFEATVVPIRVEEYNYSGSGEVAQ